LIPNPLIPIGRYLSDEELEQLSVWCHAKTTRKIIFDTGYDFERKGNLDLFTDGAHVIELRSASKFTFKPKMAGWAVSNRELSIPTRSGALPQINNNAHALLQDKFNARFAKVMTVSDLITMPQVGYLALAPISYKELLDDHNVAGIPATLFGSKRKDMTILSAL
jgi:aspartate/methionine/tyrosine aminotransferase